MAEKTRGGEIRDEVQGGYTEGYGGSGDTQRDTDRGRGGGGSAMG